MIGHRLLPIFTLFAARILGAQILLAAFYHNGPHIDQVDHIIYVLDSQVRHLERNIASWSRGLIFLRDDGRNRYKIGTETVYNIQAEAERALRPMKTLIRRHMSAAICFGMGRDLGERSWREISRTPT